MIKFSKINVGLAFQFHLKFCLSALVEVEEGKKYSTYHKFYKYQ